MATRPSSEAAEAAKRLQLELATLQREINAGPGKLRGGDDASSSAQSAEVDDEDHSPRSPWRIGSASGAESQSGASPNGPASRRATPAGRRSSADRARHAWKARRDSEHSDSGAEASGADRMNDEAFMQSWSQMAKSSGKAGQARGSGRAKGRPVAANGRMASDETASAEAESSDEESTPANDDGDGQEHRTVVRQLWGADVPDPEAPSMAAQWRQMVTSARPARPRKRPTFRVAQTNDLFKQNLREELRIVDDATTPVKGPALPHESRQTIDDLGPSRPAHPQSAPRPTRPPRVSHRRHPSDPHLGAVLADPKPWQRNPWGGERAVRRAPDIGIPRSAVVPRRPEHWLLQRARELGPGSLDSLGQLLKQYIAHADGRMGELAEKRKRQGGFRQAHAKGPAAVVPNGDLQGPRSRAAPSEPDSVASAQSMGQALLADHFARSRSGFGTSRESATAVGRRMPWERQEVAVGGVRTRLKDTRMPQMSSEMVGEGSEGGGRKRRVTSPLAGAAGEAGARAERPPRPRVSFSEVETPGRRLGGSPGLRGRRKGDGRAAAPAVGPLPGGYDGMATPDRALSKGRAKRGTGGSKGKKGKGRKKKTSKKGSPGPKDLPANPHRAPKHRAPAPKAASAPASARKGRGGASDAGPHGVDVGLLTSLLGQLKGALETQQRGESSTAVLDVLRSLEAAAAPANANANAPHRGRLEEPPSDAAAGRAGASTLTPGLATPARRPAPSAASRQGLPVEAGMPPVAHDELLFANTPGDEHSRLRALARLGLIPKPPSLASQMRAERKHAAKTATEQPTPVPATTSPPWPSSSFATSAESPNAASGHHFTTAAPHYAATAPHYARPTAASFLHGQFDATPAHSGAPASDAASAAAPSAGPPTARSPTDGWRSPAAATSPAASPHRPAWRPNGVAPLKFSRPEPAKPSRRAGPERATSQGHLGITGPASPPSQGSAPLSRSLPRGSGGRSVSATEPTTGRPGRPSLSDPFAGLDAPDLSLAPATPALSAHRAPALSGGAGSGPASRASLWEGDGAYNGSVTSDAATADGGVYLPPASASGLMALNTLATLMEGEGEDENVAPTSTDAAHSKGPSSAAADEAASPRKSGVVEASVDSTPPPGSAGGRVGTGAGAGAGVGVAETPLLTGALTMSVSESTPAPAVRSATEREGSMPTVERGAVGATTGAAGVTVAADRAVPGSPHGAAPASSAGSAPGGGVTAAVAVPGASPASVQGEHHGGEGRVAEWAEVRRTGSTRSVSREVLGDVGERAQRGMDAEGATGGGVAAEASEGSAYFAQAHENGAGVNATGGARDRPGLTHHHRQSSTVSPGRVRTPSTVSQSGPAAPQHQHYRTLPAGADFRADLRALEMTGPALGMTAGPDSLHSRASSAPRNTRMSRHQRNVSMDSVSAAGPGGAAGAGGGGGGGGGSYATREAMRKELRGKGSRAAKSSVVGSRRNSGVALSQVGSGSEEMEGGGGNGAGGAVDVGLADDAQAGGRGATWHPGNRQRNERVLRAVGSLPEEAATKAGAESQDGPQGLSSIQSDAGNGGPSPAQSRRSRPEPGSPVGAGRAASGAAAGRGSDQAQGQGQAASGAAGAAGAKGADWPRVAVPSEVVSGAKDSSGVSQSVSLAGNLLRSSPTDPSASPAPRDDPIADLLRAESDSRGTGAVHRFHIDQELLSPRDGGQSDADASPVGSLPAVGAAAGPATGGGLRAMFTAGGTGAGAAGAGAGGVSGAGARGGTGTPGVAGDATPNRGARDAGREGRAGGVGAGPGVAEMVQAAVRAGAGAKGAASGAGSGSGAGAAGGAGPGGPGSGRVGFRPGNSDRARRPPEDDSAWNAYRPDPEADRRLAVVMMLREGMQVSAPNVLALRVRDALMTLRDGQRMHKHKMLTTGSSPHKKGSDRRVQLVLKASDTGRGTIIVLAYRGGMLGMSAREYVVQGCELAAGALRGQGSLGIRVHTAHGEVDLTCTDAQQWCLYAAGLNAALCARDGQLGPRGLDGILASLEWHPAVTITGGP